VLVGLQDITAWVDFTALADAGIDAGLELEGFVTQAHFLLGAGMTEVLAAEAGSGQFGLREQAKQLVLPGEMGERFKMMVFSRDWPDDRAEPGIHDMRHRL
jgi:SAM-dependent MidA family methyltransferase